MPHQHWPRVVAETPFECCGFLHAAHQPCDILPDHPLWPDQIDVQRHRRQRDIGRLQYFVDTLYRRIRCIPVCSPTEKHLHRLESLGPHFCRRQQTSRHQRKFHGSLLPKFEPAAVKTPYRFFWC